MIEELKQLGEAYKAFEKKVKSSDFERQYVSDDVENLKKQKEKLTADVKALNEQKKNVAEVVQNEKAKVYEQIEKELKDAKSYKSQVEFEILSVRKEQKELDELREYLEHKIKEFESSRDNYNKNAAKLVEKVTSLNDAISQVK